MRQGILSGQGGDNKKLGFTSLMMCTNLNQNGNFTGPDIYKSTGYGTSLTKDFDISKVKKIFWSGYSRLDENNAYIQVSNDRQSYTTKVQLRYLTGGGGELDVTDWKYLRLKVSNSAGSSSDAQLVILSCSFDTGWAVAI